MIVGREIVDCGIVDLGTVCRINGARGIVGRSTIGTETIEAALV